MENSFLPKFGEKGSSNRCFAFLIKDFCYLVFLKTIQNKSSCDFLLFIANLMSSKTLALELLPKMFLGKQIVRFLKVQYL